MDKMSLEGARKQWKKHYRYAMKLKEGGKAWDREMTICENLREVIKSYGKQW